MEQVLTAVSDQPIAWAIVLFLVLRDVGPKLWPDLFKWLSRDSTEERLFKLLEKNNDNLANLGQLIQNLTVAVVAVNQRVDHLESTLSDSDVAAFLKWFKSLPAYEELQRQDRDQVRRPKG